MKKIFIVCSGGVQKNIYMNKDLYIHLNSSIQNLYIIDIENIGFSNKKNEYSTLVFEDSKFNIIKINSYFKFISFIKEASLVLSFFSEKFKDWYIFFFLARYKIPLVSINNMSEVVSFSYRENSKKYYIKVLDLFNKNFKRGIDYIFLSMIKLGVFKKIDLLFTSRVDYKNLIESRFKYKVNEVKLINSKFYDSFVVNKKEPTEEYIVFLDSMVPYHQDQIDYGYKPIDKDLYYSHLNMLFDKLEKLTNKSVVICLHPKCDDSLAKVDFLGRKTVKYKTDIYIAKASLVLFHDTSSSNSIVFYNKNVLQLISTDFNDFVYKICVTLNDKLGFNKIDFINDDLENLQSILNETTLNKEKTKEFKDNYIVASREEKLGATQVIEHLHKKFDIVLKRESNEY